MDHDLSLADRQSLEPDRHALPQCQLEQRKVVDRVETTPSPSPTRIGIQSWLERVPYWIPITTAGVGEPQRIGQATGTAYHADIWRWTLSAYGTDTSGRRLIMRSVQHDTSYPNDAPHPNMFVLRTDGAPDQHPKHIGLGYDAYISPNRTHAAIAAVGEVRVVSLQEDSEVGIRVASLPATYRLSRA